VQVCVT